MGSFGSPKLISRFFWRPEGTLEPCPPLTANVLKCQQICFIGIPICKHTFHMLYGSIPECPPLSLPGFPRPQRTFPNDPNLARQLGRSRFFFLGDARRPAHSSV